MPPEPGAGFVVVTNLNPKRESVPHEIIGRYTDLTVKVAEDAAEVGANCVHVLPADALLGIKTADLRFENRIRCARAQTNRHFLSALPTDRGDVSVAVVLSGRDGDGAARKK